MHPSDLPSRVQAILDIPLNRQLGLTYDGHADGAAHAHFDVHEGLAVMGGLHGGAMYALLDACCLLAVLPTLADDQHAVTHDLHVSMMRPVAAGARCDLRAQVLRRGRSLAFLDATASVDGQLVAVARITKSVVAR